MKVLVTGGAGFIGSHLVDALVRRGHEVTVLDNFSTGLESNLGDVRQDVRLFRGDLRDRDTVQDAVRGVHAVLHHAAVVSVPASLEDPVTCAEVNVLGTARILEECRRAGVRRLNFASSSAVYGDTNESPVSESSTTAPISPYGVHKLAGEHLCRIAALGGGPDAISFRYFNVYGPRQRSDSDYAAVVPIFRSRCRRGDAPVIYGDGAQTRDFVHVSDVVEANLMALEHAANWEGAVFNLARGVATSVGELARIISDHERFPDPPRYAPARRGDIHHSVADIGRLEAEFRWSPPTDLREGIARAG